MTDEQINAAIHAVLGNPIGCPRCSDPECAYNNGLNYCNDLNAMHEAEEILTVDQWESMFEHLITIRWRNAPRRARYGIGNGKELSPSRAKSHQRAEAFLRTLGKWEEGK